MLFEIFIKWAFKFSVDLFQILININPYSCQTRDFIQIQINDEILCIQTYHRWIGMCVQVRKRKMHREKWQVTFSIIVGMNFCPPNPGSTVITRTISTGFSHSTCEFQKNTSITQVFPFAQIASTKTWALNSKLSFFLLLRSIG